MTHKETTSRDQEIVQSYQRGETLRTIAPRHGLTAERIRQILERSGVDTRAPGRPADPNRPERPSKPTTQERFFRRLTITEDLKHWIWDRLTDKGYGGFTVDRKVRYAHRAAFFVVNGRWPKRLLKRCDVTGCVNPACWEETDSEV